MQDLRRRRGCSQAELAKLSGVSRKSIGLIENGRRNPRGSTLRCLAEALGVEVGYFFGEG